ncbi:MAG: tetratricopeptide repeat protein [Opitutaceae bacterium]|nr:tetratricopeptide repeat protein [Verrucomicrobiales bacterium]
MKPLEPPDRFHWLAAQGWLELGNHREAVEELEKVSPSLSSHPDVLETRWQICAKQGQWDAALDIASTLTGVKPEHPVAWIHRSFALHELKRTQEARDNLSKVIDQFPDDETMRYNLACYECQLGNLSVAMEWLGKALQLGDRQQIRRMALHDPDLEPLRTEIKKLR